MRELIGVFLLVSVCSPVFQPALALEISIAAPTSPDATGRSVLLLSGDIRLGDAEKLATAITKLRVPFILELDSPGGDVREALHMAQLVRAVHMNTRVRSGAICASACFFIFLAGEQHLALGILSPDNPAIKSSVSGYIGLHRPNVLPNGRATLSSGDYEKIQHGVMQEIGDYLRGEDVPQRLIDLMMTRPSNDIYWLTQDDIDQLGEYSPSHEELLITRCGYNRSLSLDVIKAKLSGDPASVARAEARENAFIDCSVTAFPDEIVDRRANLERLRNGWRPWQKKPVAKTDVKPPR